MNNPIHKMHMRFIKALWVDEGDVQDQLSQAGYIVRPLEGIEIPTQEWQAWNPITQGYGEIEYK